MSRCLGDLLAPLADGALPPAQAERALAHVAVCPSCRRELAEERRVRALLAGVEVPDVPPALLLSLTRIPDLPAVPVAAGIVPPPPLGGAGAVAAAATALRPATPRRGGLAVGAVAALAASAGLAMLAAAPQAATSVPAVVPDAAGFAAEHAATVGGASMTAPGLRAGAGDRPAGTTTVAPVASTGSGLGAGSGPALAAFALPTSLIPAAVAAFPDRSDAPASRTRVVTAAVRAPDADLSEASATSAPASPAPTTATDASAPAGGSASAPAVATAPAAP